MNKEENVVIHNINVAMDDFNVNNPTRQNIEYAFSKLLFNLNAAIASVEYKDSNDKYNKMLEYVKKWETVYLKNGDLINVNHEELLDVYDQLAELRCQGQYAERADQWHSCLMLLRKAQIDEKEKNNGTR